MKIQPMGNRILVKEIVEKEEQEKTKGGIFIPVQAQDNRKYNKRIKISEIIATGDTRDYKIGQKIIHDKHGSSPSDIVDVEINGEIFYLVHIDSVYGVINEEEN